MTRLRNAIGRRSSLQTSHSKEALDDGQTPKKVTEQDVFYERLAEAAQRFAGTLHYLCGPGIALFEPDLEVIS
jgi:hypothetical protein